MNTIELCGQTLDLDNLQSGYFNMDCMDGMAKFPDKYFDLAVVDPPYGGGGVNSETMTEQDSAAGSISTNLPLTVNHAWGGRFERYNRTGTASGDGSTDTSSQQNRREMGGKVREKNHKLGSRTQR